MRQITIEEVAALIGQPCKIIGVADPTPSGHPEVLLEFADTEDVLGLRVCICGEHIDFIAATKEDIYDPSGPGEI